MIPCHRLFSPFIFNARYSRILTEKNLSFSGGAALYYFKFMKPKQNVKGGTDLDDFEFDEYGGDEPEPDDTDGEASENEADNEM